MTRTSLSSSIILKGGLGARPERMLAELRRCHLLLIGCNLADWLSRFFIRLANQERRSSDRPKKEFLAGDGIAHDQSLTLFLERFSHNTRIYPGPRATLSPSFFGAGASGTRNQRRTEPPKGRRCRKR